MKKSSKILSNITLALIFCFNWGFFAYTLAIKNADVLIGGSVSYTLPVPATTDYPDLTFELSTNGTATALVYVNNATGDVVVPAKVSSGGEVYTVTRISADHVGAKNMTSIIIPATVVSIFLNASSKLTTVTFQEGSQMEELGMLAFSSCSSLTTINLPESLKTIGPSSFSSCKSLTSITIPKNVTTIYSYAFSGCTSLTSVIFENLEGWTANGDSLDLSAPEQNAIYLTSTYVGYDFIRS